jgi:hypothetical protein
VAFDRLVRIGRRTEGDLVARPSRFVQLAPQDFHEVPLDQDDRGELVVRVHLELHVVPPREAVMAAVRTAAIGIQRPLERHSLHAVQGRPADDLLIARFVGSPLGLGQGGGSAGPHPVGDLPRRRVVPAEIKEERV